MALTESQLLDLQKLALPDLSRGDLVQVAQTKQNYVFYNQIMREQRMTIQSGTSMKTRVMTDTSGQARMTGLFQVDNVSRAEVISDLETPWRRFETKYMWEKREVLECRGAAELKNLLNVYKLDALIALAELVENQGWGRRASSTNTSDLDGVPYWITLGATTGFTGSNPNGHSTKGGIDADVKTRFGRNYSAIYTDVSASDFVLKLRDATRLTHFNPPLDATDGAPKAGPRGFYTNNTVFSALETFLDNRNDNLGTQVLGMTPMIGRIPVVYAAVLDGNVWHVDPLYGMNWDTWRIGFLAGDFMRQTGPRELPDQHNTMAVWVDNSAAIQCKYPRENFVLAKSAVSTN